MNLLLCVFHESFYYLKFPFMLYSCLDEIIKLGVAITYLGNYRSVVHHVNNEITDKDCHNHMSRTYTYKRSRMRHI